MAVSDNASGPEPLATGAGDEIGVATFPGFIEAEPGLFRDDEGDGRYTLYSIVYGIPLPSPRTPDDLRALELYPDEVCAHISEPFAKRPGFASDVHRRDFPLVIRAWASAALAEQRGASAGRKPGDAIRQVAKVERKAAALIAQIRALPPAARRSVLARDVSSGSGLMAALLLVRSNAHHFGQTQRRPRRRPTADEALRSALGLLAEIYRDATGRRPAITKDPYRSSGLATGPSLGFARRAIAPLFPEAGSVQGLWEDVTGKMPRD